MNRGAVQLKNGSTPLHVAFKRDRVTAVQFLLSTGRVDPWCKKSNCCPLVQLACSVTMNEPHKGKSSVREPHNCNVNMLRVYITASEPHSDKCERASNRWCNYE